MIDTRTNDREQLKWLAAFHLIIAGLWLFSLWIVTNQLRILNAFDEAQSASGPNAFASDTRGNPLAWYVKGLAALISIFVCLNIVSAVLLFKQKLRSFSLAVSGVNCLHAPIGTALGVVTFLVLFRPSVRSLYSENPLHPASAEP
ncbi:hypothetical protein [Stieleria varia]|uniref:Uncharacterized protein n=1 Tax=Stieleria varia TaxID=2528005 RepID=A0A5C6BAD9_9BACT|nr:hypothetical protein [Stieleria varia]TWU08236.1 hypothetical protein Pla52n_08180 [Stieleria varia]